MCSVGMKVLDNQCLNKSACTRASKYVLRQVVLFARCGMWTVYRSR